MGAAVARCTALSVGVLALSCQLIADLSERKLGSGGAPNQDAGQDASGGLGGSAGAAGSSGVAGSAGASEAGPSVEGYLFDRVIGDAKQQLVLGLATDPASGGELVVHGEFAGEMAFGNGVPTLVSAASEGALDSFVSRFDANGKALWAKKILFAPSTGLVAVVTADTGRLVGVGSFSGTLDLGDGVSLTAKGSVDMDVIRFDQTGHVELAKNYPGSTVNSVTAAAGGDEIILGGTPSSELDFGGSSSPVTPDDGKSFVAKLDAQGDGIWARSFPNCPLLVVRSVARAPDGSVAVAGVYTGGCALDAWTLAIAPGYTTPDCTAFLLAPDGSVKWAFRTGAECSMAQGALTQQFGMALGGTVIGNTPFSPAVKANDPDWMVFAVGQDGLALWGRNLARPGVDLLTAVGVYPTGAIYLTGESATGLLVAKYEVNGDLGWAKQLDVTAPFGNPGPYVGLVSDGVVIAGSLIKPTDFGGGVVTPQGDTDLFLVKYAP